MEYSIKRWETPVSDKKEVYFYDTCFFRRDGRADLIFAVETDEIVFEFTFISPLAYMVHTGDIINTELETEMFKIKPGITFTVGMSFLEKVLDEIVLHWYSPKNDLSRFYEVYYIYIDDIAISVMTQNEIEIEEYPKADYDEVRRNRYK